MVRDWIAAFLMRYKGTVAGGTFPDGKGPEGKVELEAFVLAWITAFATKSPPVTEAEADAAMLYLAERPPQFRNQHIPAVINHVLGSRMLAAGAAPGASEAETSALSLSAGCPECTRKGRPTGFAERLAIWHSWTRPMLVNLFCRCPMGRFRRANDPELFQGERKRIHDDLQARPELWHVGLSHGSWTDRLAEVDVEIDPDCEGKWRYILPGEPSPEPIESIRELAVQTSRDLAPSAKRRWPEGLGRVEPAVPIPPRPAPAPEPSPEPAAAEADDDVTW